MCRVSRAVTTAYRCCMINAMRRRYLDLLASIYIYNEHRGYTAIDRVLEAVRARSPGDTAFIAAVEKHRADERKPNRPT